MSTPHPEPPPDRLAAFDRIVATYEAALLRYATRILRDANAAQDVVQTAFLRLYRGGPPDWTPGPVLSTWLYRVTHNAAVDHLRRETRLQRLHAAEAEDKPTDLAPDRGAAFRISEAAAAAAQALRQLDLRDQQLVILKIYEEKSYREIAAITGLTESNVGYILHHAMKKLAAALREAARPGSEGST